MLERTGNELKIWWEAGGVAYDLLETERLDEDHWFSVECPDLAARVTELLEAGPDLLFPVERVEELPPA